MILEIFFVVAFVWAASCAAYWLYRSKMPRRYNAYAAGRIDTLFVIFMVSTFGLVVSGVLALVEQNV